MPTHARRERRTHSVARSSDTQLLQPLAAGLVLVVWAAILSLIATGLANRQELR